MKKGFALFLSFLIAMTLNFTVFASDDIISEIKTKAESEKYRFILVENNKITDEIKENIATNDKYYISKNPVGSIKIKVFDAETGKPIKDALCLLSFSQNRSTVNVDGSKQQISNPFLLFNLGKTPDNGEILFKETYFYKSRIIKEGTAPFTDSLQVVLAYLVDDDPEIQINYSAKNYIATSDVENFNKILAKLNNRNLVKFSELKAIVNEVASQKYSEIIRYLFKDKFAVFSDNVVVKITNEPQFKNLLDKGIEKLTIGELRKYMEDNKALFEKFVAARYYDDFAGFKPNFTLQYNPEYESMVTYKDGTKKPSKSIAYLGMQIFDNVGGGNGYAVASSAFSYRAYIYAEGYMEGKAIGAVIKQDYVDKDIIMNIYVSKDAPPLVVSDKTNAIFGVLKDTKDKPIPSAKISIIDTSLSAVTNEEGYFSFTKLKNENVKLSIINPENGEPLEGKVIYNNKEYPLEKVPIKFSGENEIFKIIIIGGTIEKGVIPNINSPSNSIILLIVVGVLIILVLLIIAILIVSKNKIVCKNCGKKISKNSKYCKHCGNSK